MVSWIELEVKYYLPSESKNVLSPCQCNGMDCCEMTIRLDVWPFCQFKLCSDVVLHFHNTQNCKLDHWFGSSNWPRFALVPNQTSATLVPVQEPQ